SPVFVPGRALFQVLYAIGGGLIAMTVLRRLGGTTILAMALALFVGGEALTGLVLWLTGGNPTVLTGLLLTGGQFDLLIVAYPLVPWLAIMLLGWWFGDRLANSARSVTPGRVGVVALAALA